MQNNPLLTNKTKVLVYGLGLHGGGESVVRYLQKIGCDIRLVDEKPRSYFKNFLRTHNSVSGVFGRWRKEDVIWADVIIKNPGVPQSSQLLKFARLKKKNVLSDVTLFVAAIQKKPEFAITGTRGKSTTTALIEHALSLRKKVVALGNNRKPVLASVAQAKKYPVVLELSSFQIEDAQSFSWSPKIGIFTNLYPDHLNRYHSFEQYFNSKKLLFKRQVKTDIMVVNFDDARVKAFSKAVAASKYFFSMRPLPKKITGTYWNNETLYFQKGTIIKKILSVRQCKLLGSHNQANIAAAASALIAYNVAFSFIRKGLTSFAGLPGRIEFRSNRRGILWFNDTTATNAEALVEALTTIRSRYPEKNIHAIIGGSDKGFGYKKISSISTDPNIFFYVLQGSASKKMIEALRSKHVFSFFGSLKQAFSSLLKNAKKGDVTLLSPGAASFGMFKHEFDRGDQFNRLISNL